MYLCKIYGNLAELFLAFESFQLCPIIATPAFRAAMTAAHWTAATGSISARNVNTSVRAHTLITLAHKATYLATYLVGQRRSYKRSYSCNNYRLTHFRS